MLFLNMFCRMGTLRFCVICFPFFGRTARQLHSAHIFCNTDLGKRTRSINRSIEQAGREAMVSSCKAWRSRTGARAVQVGEFYETYGIDAILMVQWAGLNPMGRASKLTPPRAGAPSSPAPPLHPLPPVVPPRALSPRGRSGVGFSTARFPLPAVPLC